MSEPEKGWQPPPVGAEPSKDAWEAAKREWYARIDGLPTVHARIAGFAEALDAFAAARVAEATALPPLDGEFDYKGDDPVWQIIFRWIKVSVPAAAEAMHSDGRMHSLHRTIAAALAEARAQEREPLVRALEDAFFWLTDVNTTTSDHMACAERILRALSAEPQESDR